MTPQEWKEQFAQDVYLTRYNRFIDDITDEDGQAEVAKTSRWLNLYLDELEMETDSNGVPMNWNFVRNWDAEIGTVATPNQQFPLPAGTLRLVIDEDRPLVIMHDGAIVSRWDVVAPNQITKRAGYASEKRVVVVRNQLIFSEPLKDYEIGGTIIADSISSIPRLTDEDASVFTTVAPYQLLVLGVAKNATLPDIVQGGLAPSFIQKYADLLDQTKFANNNSSVADDVISEDFSSIGGIY